MPANEQVLSQFFEAINSNDVEKALSLCSDDIEATYADPGRNWQGKARGRTVMTAILGQLSRAPHLCAKYEVVETTDSTLRTKEDWGHPNMKISCLYTFDSDGKLLSINS